MSRVARFLLVGLASAVLWFGTGQQVFGQDAPKTPSKPATPRGKARAKAAVPNNPDPPPAAEAPSPAPAEAAEPVVFSRDIAPILLANCTTCHNPKDKERRGKLDLSTFEAILAGTPAEKILEPGKPAESHLVARIKGEETPRMPLGGNRTLSPTAIATIERWVLEGGALDQGHDPKAPIASFALSAEELRRAELAKQSLAERDAKVEAVGRDRYKKGDPKAAPEAVSSPHFLLLGTLPKDRANLALKALESQYALVRSLVGPKALDWGEKASVYVFNDLASYGEFIRIVGNGRVDPDETGASDFAIPQPYVAVVDPLGGRSEPSRPTRKRPSRAKKDAAAEDGPTRSLAGVVSEPFVAGVIAKAGKPPRWLSLGLGAHSAARVEPRGSYSQDIRREAFALWRQGWTTKANDALGSATKSSEIRAIGFVVIDFLSTEASPALAPMTRAMLEGQNKLDDALKDVLGTTREQFLAVLGNFVGSYYGRAR